VLSATAALTVSQQTGVLTIQSSGAGGRQVGIPSWKAVLRRDDAGNISALHVPADHPAPLSSRTGQWPITVLQSKNDQDVAGTMSRGRENYAAFEVETFQLVEQAPGMVVVRVAGPSGKRSLIHNNKDHFEPKVKRMLYEKLTGISAGPVAKGARQTFKVRFIFETQQWD
jgi:hypothetical protein